VLFNILLKYNKKITVDVDAKYQGKTNAGVEIFNAWKYNILVQNKGSSIVQIVGRYWNIVDSNGFVKEVFGDDVVGKQPIIDPGKSFYYSSYTNLRTVSGIMHGKYRLLDLESNNNFDVIIPAFSLDLPEIKSLAN